MAYTNLQLLRKARAVNKGQNKILARALRYAATMLDQIGPVEFSRGEIRRLQSARKMPSTRLHMNAIAKSMQIALGSGKDIPPPNPKDL